MAAKISVERLLEQEVDEINRAGEERYIKPFSLSEELTHFASKIDFYEGIDSIQTTTDEDEEKDKSADQKDLIKENKWHWEGVHSKLRIALSETCVMLDVLQNLNKKRYLVLDPIQQSAEPEKQTVQMLEKRKFLARAGSIIAKGAASLHTKKDDSEPIVVEDNENEYYMQLMQLRQYWRVKKSGNQITGDVSYRSAGSKFWHPGLFEVKADHSEKSEKTLSINVSPDLMLTSEIKVIVIDENHRNPWKAVSPLSFKAKDSENKWEDKLKLAQHHLFNKELFSHLSNDAFQGSFMGVEVLDSQITCKILGGDVKVIISHDVGNTNETNAPEEDLSETNEFKSLLTHLLQKHHKQNAKCNTPYPSTSTNYQKQTRSSTIFNLLNRNTKFQQQSILNDFLAETKHKVWVKRLKHYFDEKSKLCKDPNVIVHWNAVNLKLKSAVTVSMITKFDSNVVIRTSFFIMIHQDGLHFTFQDCGKFDLPFDINSLDALMNAKIRLHLLRVAKSLCPKYGWSVITCATLNYTMLKGNTVGFPESRLTCSSVVKNRSISVTVTDITVVKVEISDDDAPTFLDDEFKCLSKSFKPVSWDSIQGKSFVEKFQAILLYY